MDSRMGSGVVAMAYQCSQHWPHHPTNRLKNWPECLYFLYIISQFLATHMCQVAHCALCVMCTTHVHNPGPWPSVWQGHWVPQAVGPIDFGYRGGLGSGLGSPKAKPRPPMGHLIAPTCCMLALVDQLGPWEHWVVAPGAHTSPLWIHATTQVDPIVKAL